MSLHRLLRAVIAAEQPILESHMLDMWEYAVLTALERGPARTQAELAAAVGRDKTRLIPLLDRLGMLGMVERAPDPADRRNRIVTLTDTGRATVRDCRAAIRAMEGRLLAGLAPEERSVFVAALERLADRA